MNVIPQNVRDGFGKLIDPLAIVFIRLHVRPNLITTVGTLVVIASATAFGVGWVHLGGFLLLVSGMFDLLDGRVARRADMTTTFGAFYDSTLDRVGESALFSGIAVYFLRGGVPPERLTLAVVACLVALAASLIVSYTRARAEGLGLTAKVARRAGAPAGRPDAVFRRREPRNVVVLDRRRAGARHLGDGGAARALRRACGRGAVCQAAAAPA